jgi:type II secretory pathway component PulF
MTQLQLENPETRLPRPITSVPLTVGAYFIALPLLFMLMFIVPNFEQIFKDFKTEPPALTRLAMSLSHWCANDYGWAWLLVLPAIVPIAVTRVLWHPRTQRQEWHRALILVAIVFATILLITGGIVLA